MKESGLMGGRALLASLMVTEVSRFRFSLGSCEERNLRRSDARCLASLAAVVVVVVLGAAKRVIWHLVMQVKSRPAVILPLASLTGVLDILPQVPMLAKY